MEHWLTEQTIKLIVIAMSLLWVSGLLEMWGNNNLEKRVDELENK